MSGGVAVILLRGVVVLDQVVPDVPLPNDIAARGVGRLNLDDRVGREISIPSRLHNIGHESRGGHVGGSLGFDHQRDHVAVRKLLEVVMHEVRGRRIRERPHHIALPVVLPELPALAAADVGSFVLYRIRAKKMAVRQKIGHESRWVVAAVPGVDHLAVVVDQVRVPAMQRGHQDVTRRGFRRIVQKQADRLVLGRQNRGQGSQKEKRRQRMSPHAGIHNQ